MRHNRIINLKKKRKEEQTPQQQQQEQVQVKRQEAYKMPFIFNRQLHPIAQYENMQRVEWEWEGERERETGREQAIQRGVRDGRYYKLRQFSISFSWDGKIFLVDGGWKGRRREEGSGRETSSENRLQAIRHQQQELHSQKRQQRHRQSRSSHLDRDAAWGPTAAHTQQRPQAEAVAMMETDAKAEQQAHEAERYQPQWQRRRRCTVESQSTESK